MVCCECCKEEEMISKGTAVVSLLRVSLGFIFVISGLSKFTDLHSFAATIKDFDVVPDSLDNVLAAVISSLELISGLMLLLGLWTKFCCAAVCLSRTEPIKQHWSTEVFVFFCI